MSNMMQPYRGTSSKPGRHTPYQRGELSMAHEKFERKKVSDSLSYEQLLSI
jgi:hypothetical protein